MPSALVALVSQAVGVQVISSADLEEALEGTNQEQLEPESPATAEQMHNLADPADAQTPALTEPLLIPSDANKQPPQAASSASLAAAEDCSTSNASLVHHYEELAADQPAAALPPLIDFSSADWPSPLQAKSRIAKRPHLAPLQIDGDLLLHTSAPAEEIVAEVPAVEPTGDLTLVTRRPHLAPLQIDGDLLLQTSAPAEEVVAEDPADEPTGDLTPVTAPANIQSQLSMPVTPARTPRARHQSALQGATARNQAAIEAHRARLKEHGTASTTHSAAVQHGWAASDKKNAAPASPRMSTPKRSSLHAGQHGLSGRPSTPTAGSTSPKPILTRFGSVAAASTLRSARSLSPPVASGVPLRRGGSVAFPSSSSVIQRRSLDLAQGRPLSPPRGGSLSPTLQRGASVTVAEIMKQNSRLPPLDLVPPAPTSPISALRPLPPLRRSSSAMIPSGTLSGLRRGSSVGTALRRGLSVSPSAAPDGYSKALSPRSSPQQRSEPSPGSAQLLSRRSSVTFSPEVRQNIKLTALSPDRTGSGIPLEHRGSGVQKFPNRCAYWPCSIL